MGWWLNMGFQPLKSGINHFFKIRCICDVRFRWQIVTIVVQVELLHMNYRTLVNLLTPGIHEKVIHT